MAPESKTMKGGARPKRRPRLPAAGLALALVWGIWLGWRTFDRQRVAAAAVPARPALTGWAVALAPKLADAEEKAGGYGSPIAGLAALSRLYHANGFYNEALQCYEGLRRLQPKEPRWPYLEAAILAGFGRLDEARPFYERAVALAPDYVPARVRLGDVLLKTNRPADAALAYRAVLALVPAEPYALHGLARCDLAAGDWSAARDHLRQAIADHPDFIGALSLLVTVDEHLGDQDEADSLKTTIGTREYVDIADAWSDALTDDCYDPYRLSVAASMANFSGDGPRAQQLLERAIAMAPGTGSYHRQLGSMFFHANDFGPARAEVEKAVEISPDNPYSWDLLVKILIAMGQTEAADSALARGLANCPDSPDLHLERAHRLNQAGDLEDAIPEYREAYRLWPSEGGPLVELATVYFNLNRRDDALAALREALQKQPEQPLALAMLTFDSISRGDKESALQWWEHVRHQPRTPAQAVDSVRQAYQQKFGEALP
jgi:tetratricopeptide (TPR) repeat protein